MAIKKGNYWAILLRIVVHFLGLLPLLWLFYAIPNGLLGGDPVKELIHFLGMGALQLLMLSLVVSPLVEFSGIKLLTKMRRPLGLWSFTWASLHLTSWLALDLVWDWSLIGSELVSRTYIVVGAAVWLILFCLALTSIPLFIRRLGKRWKPLHRTVYVALPLAWLHFVWSVKSGWVEPGIYLCAVVALLLARMSYFKNQFFHSRKLPLR